MFPLKVRKMIWREERTKRSETIRNQHHSFRRKMAAPKAMTIDTDRRNHVQIIFKIGAKEREVSKMMKNFSQMSI